MKNLNGTISSAAIHMNGLQRMVELRGGLSSLGMSGILRRMVLWYQFRFTAFRQSSDIHVTGRTFALLRDFKPRLAFHLYILRTYQIYQGSLQNPNLHPICSFRGAACPPPRSCKDVAIH